MTNELKNAFSKKNVDDEAILKDKKAKDFINLASGETDNKFINLDGRPKKKTAKKESRVTLYLTDEQKNTLEKKAENNGLSLSAFILLKALN